MKLYSTFVLCGLLAGIAAADPAPTTPATTPPATQPANDPGKGPAVNKNCPIERDHPVDPTIFIIYKGQKIGFCCEDCVKDFKEDPEKYLKTMK